MDKAKLDRYAELKVLEKKIKKEIDELNPEIRDMMTKAGHDKVDAGYGTFTLSSRTTWEYSPAVEELQKKEKALGVAKAVINQSLTFKEVKASDVV